MEKVRRGVALLLIAGVSLGLSAILGFQRSVAAANLTTVLFLAAVPLAGLGLFWLIRGLWTAEHVKTDG